MKNLIEKLEWWFDYYLVFFLYNPNKIDRYHQYMEEKWEVQSGRLPVPINDDVSRESINPDPDIEIGAKAHSK